MPHSAYNPSDLLDVFVMHSDLMPNAGGTAVDTPSGSWIDASKYEYVLACYFVQDAVASATIVVKVQESDLSTGASPADVVALFGTLPLTEASVVSQGAVIKEIRTHARKRFFGILARQSAGATGQPISVLLIGVKSQLSSDMTAFASQPALKGPMT